MYQLKAFRGRRFADTVVPCSNEASGPGRQNAAEWLRLGFHDMATADVAAGTGGLDGSIQYMLDNGENLGPGFNTTLKFLATYLSPRSSISDLIALGVSISVRSCGGPVIPVRGGRIDASGPGNTGVPQPEHDIATFNQQFTRMGFTPEEMIQVTACGHTLGGVHSNEFPELITEPEVGTDSTVAEFDNKVVTEYLLSNTSNPLVIGPAVALGKDSDRRIFASDGNVTAKALADPTEFQAVCQKVLQKMIDTVPAGVALSDPIQPYMLKPVGLQLTLDQGGSRMSLTGDIRLRTTYLPHSEIKNLELVYKDRDGGNQCGKCTITATVLGGGKGLDDTFSFFPIEGSIPTRTGVSSFTVTVNLKNGSRLYFDNNGHSYPLQDGVMLLRPQSCLLQHSGVFSATAAVRNDRATLPATLMVSYKVPRPGLPVPGLHNMTMSMARGPCVGLYTLYTAKWTIPGGISFASKIDIISGEGANVIVDDFNDAAELPGNCAGFDGPPQSQCRTPVVEISTTTKSIAYVPPATTLTTSIPMPTSATVYASSTATKSPLGNSSTLASEHEIHHLGESFSSFIQYLTNYIVNYFFGYDRWQLVNNQLGRVT